MGQRSRATVGGLPLGDPGRCGGDGCKTSPSRWNPSCASVGPTSARLGAIDNDVDERAGSGRQRFRRGRARQRRIRVGRVSRDARSSAPDDRSRRQSGGWRTAGAMGVIDDRRSSEFPLVSASGKGGADRPGPGGPLSIMDTVLAATRCAHGGRERRPLAGAGRGDGARCVDGWTFEQRALRRSRVAEGLGQEYVKQRADDEGRQRDVRLQRAGTLALSHWLKGVLERDTVGRLDGCRFVQPDL
jgi:hypothetical protein